MRKLIIFILGARGGKTTAATARWWHAHARPLPQTGQPWHGAYATTTTSATDGRWYATTAVAAAAAEPTAWNATTAQHEYEHGWWRTADGSAWWYAWRWRSCAREKDDAVLTTTYTGHNLFFSYWIEI